MTTFRFSNGHIVTPAAVLTDATMVVEDGRIVSLDAAPVADTVAETIDLDGAGSCSGFVDTQVNGGGGVLFNDATTVEESPPSVRRMPVTARRRSWLR
ncbi:hypothetical protein [Sphingomonas aerolata]|uniref:hypothetical protein n=1 Tax=Sphingomonas aerolata TaxID=185951 RepID=UPI002FE0710E